jgi:hypothetical protein
VYQPAILPESFMLIGTVSIGRGGSKMVTLPSLVRTKPCKPGGRLGPSPDPVTAAVKFSARTSHRLDRNVMILPPASLRSPPLGSLPATSPLALIPAD